MIMKIQYHLAFLSCHYLLYMLHISTSVVEVALDYLLQCVFLICFFFQIQNFAATTMKYGVLKADVSNFAWIYPTGYPKQKNLYVFNLPCRVLSLQPNDCMFTFFIVPFLKRFDCGLYTMDYMDVWNGKEMVGSSLEQVCVAIQKISYCNSYFVSKYASSVLLSFLFFSLSLQVVVGARVQEACCCATPSINTQYG